MELITITRIINFAVIIAALVPTIKLFGLFFKERIGLRDVAKQVNKHMRLMIAAIALYGLVSAIINLILITGVQIDREMISIINVVRNIIFWQALDWLHKVMKRVTE